MLKNTDVFAESWGNRRTEYGWTRSYLRINHWRRNPAASDHTHIHTYGGNHSALYVSSSDLILNVNNLMLAANSLIPESSTNSVMCKKVYVQLSKSIVSLCSSDMCPTVDYVYCSHWTLCHTSFKMIFVHILFC